MTCKEYPHTDVNDRACELFDLALRAHRKEIEPVMALFDCRMLGMYPTSREPLRTFVSSMMEAERRPGVLSVSFGHGFQFADVPHAGAKVLVVADADETLARAVAQELGQRIYAERGQIGFESLSLPLEQALGRALASVEHPVVVADQSDNTGGGAPGDSTFALRWLLEHEAGDVGLAILHDPEVVRIAARAGTGATLQVRLGGKLGTTSGMPVDLTVQVGTLRRSYVHALPQDRGEPWYFPVGDVVALRHGTIDIVVGSERCQCFSPSIFDDLAIQSRQKKVLITKSYQHFHSAFSAIAAEILYMAAPGAVPPDPRLIPYTRLDTRRLYPWIADPLGSIP
jgi:microcystin degradation protein MlrC